MNCSNCGVNFKCAAADGKRDCWCEELPHVPLVGRADQDCLCPQCLGEAIAKLPAIKDDASEVAASGNLITNATTLVEGNDYYWEGPAMVFTASYLLRRGYCCESGCRHCPYEHKSESV